MKTVRTRKALRAAALFLALVLAFSTLGLSASAARSKGAYFTSGNPPFAYVITGVAPEKAENTVKLYQNEKMVSYAAYTGSYVLPAKAEDGQGLTDYALTEIGGAEAGGLGALENVPLTGLVLPGSVTVIGSRAFAGSGLKELTFPTSVTSLAPDAFSGVTLSKLTLDVCKAVSLVSDSSYRVANGLITLPAAVQDVTVSAPLTVTGPVNVAGNVTVKNSGITVAGGSLTVNGTLAGQGVIEVRDGSTLTLKTPSPAFTGSIRLTGETAVFVNGTSAPVTVQNAAGKTVSVYPGLTQLGGAKAPTDPTGPINENTGEAMMPAVSFNEGGSVVTDASGRQVTIVPEKGYRVENVKINGQDMGSITRYEFGLSDLENSVVVTFGKGEDEEGPSEPALPPDFFLDVPDTAPYAKSVAFLASNGIFFGVGKNLFAPDRLTTRAMILALLKRMEIYGNSFALEPVEPIDVEVPEKTFWYTEALVWAARNGMVNKDFSVFQPNKVVTREEVARLLSRFTALRGYSTKVDASRYNAFRDAAMLQGSARDAMVWAVSKGYLSVENSMLDPAGPMTRGEVAQLLAGYLQNN